MLTKWLAILLVGWVLRHGYFASQLGTPEFTKDPWDPLGLGIFHLFRFAMASHGQDSWLDILDAVIFSTNLELPYVRDLGVGSWGEEQIA